MNKSPNDRKFIFSLPSITVQALSILPYKESKYPSANVILPVGSIRGDKINTATRDMMFVATDYKPHRRNRCQKEPC